ncbi:hypothetical protein BCV70DRAFT_222471 [Testicularia cyperi]|uniref:Uncharacterized protein n=1 Tax=Testicularia cyperi TaxID=1882483 RepID=A0A317XWP3_9BASI|nr:hypothetical protein BCV70DRAFT_222471 [Testicularia cyperi]
MCSLVRVSDATMRNLGRLEAVSNQGFRSETFGGSGIHKIDRQRRAARRDDLNVLIAQAVVFETHPAMFIRGDLQIADNKLLVARRERIGGARAEQFRSFRRCNQPLSVRLDDVQSKRLELGGYSGGSSKEATGLQVLSNIVLRWCWCSLDAVEREGEQQQEKQRGLLSDLHDSR